MSQRHWKILRNVVIGKHKEDQLSTFKDTYQLFRIVYINDVSTKESGLIQYNKRWQLNPQNSSQCHSMILFSVSQNDTTVESRRGLEKLSGFDSTGMVYIWPCELLLVHVFLSAPCDYQLFWTLLEGLQWKRVCELAAGKFAASSLALSQVYTHKKCQLSQLEFVAITDGNEDCVAALSQEVELQKKAFKNLPELQVQKLRWSISANMPADLSEIPSGWLNSFDVVFVADCFLNIQGHAGLLFLINSLLSHNVGSTFFAVAPSRHGSLKHFQLLTDHSSPNYRLSCRFFKSEEVFNSLTQEIISADPDRLAPNLIVLQRI